MLHVGHYLPFSDYSIHHESFLSMAPRLCWLLLASLLLFHSLGIISLSLTTHLQQAKSLSSQLRLKHANDLFGVTDVLLFIKSTRNCLLLLTLSTRPESHWVLLAPSEYSIHQESFVSPPWRIQQSRMKFCYADFLLNIPSPRNHLFFAHGQCPFLHPAGSFFFPYHLLSLILKLEAYLFSFSLELGQKS